MATKKQPKGKDNKSVIKIETRRAAGKINKNSDLFDRIQPRHPLEDIFGGGGGGASDNYASPQNDLDVPANPNIGDSENNYQEHANPNSGDAENNNWGAANSNSGDEEKDFPGMRLIKNGDAESELTATGNFIGGETQNEIAGINVPKNNLREPEKERKTGTENPAKSFAAPRKVENAAGAKRRGRPATGRTKADVHLRLDPELWKQTKVIAAQNEFELSEFVELSLRNSNEIYTSPPIQKAGINVPLEDRREILFKTDARIFNLFCAYNRIFVADTQWKPKDDAVGAAYNNVDLRVIEIGIITTQINIFENQIDTKPERFKYYTREIDKFKEIGYSSGTIDEMLSIGRKNWKLVTGREVDLGFLDKV